MGEMTGSALMAIYTMLAVVAAAITAAVATSVRLLPEVIDVSIVLTGAGLGATSFTVYGALRGYSPDRIARLTFGGTVLGGAGSAFAFVIVIMADVL
jgi:hypothetical protein